MKPIIPQPQTERRTNHHGWISTEALIALIICLIAVGGGTFMGSRATHPATVETASPFVLQKDGSVIAERAPHADAKPSHQVPKGATVERIERITVQGRTPEGAADQCPPVTVELSLDRLPDDTHRVVASSPDGTILQALDISVGPHISTTPPKWSAGLSYDPIKQTPGAWVDRDMGRIRLGAEFNQVRLQIGGPVGYETRLKLGWSW